MVHHVVLCKNMHIAQCKDLLSATLTGTWQQFRLCLVRMHEFVEWRGLVILVRDCDRSIQTAIMRRQGRHEIFGEGRTPNCIQRILMSGSAMCACRNPQSTHRTLVPLWSPKKVNEPLLHWDNPSTKVAKPYVVKSNATRTSPPCLPHL